MILLECVPAFLAAEITQAVDVPVIGIGAGAHTDAQVLVMHDILGLTPRIPRFVKNYMQEYGTVQDAFKAYADDVKAGRFPTEEHSFN